MCGIVGYVGSRNAFPVLTGGLRRLEYRGYDSAGVALAAAGGLAVLRAVGAVANLDAMAGEAPAATSGIAHTRWATHGKPSVANAHPHRDCRGGIAVVHNGIIENHAALRDWLTSRGHRFTSETDTEVIAHALEEFSGGAFEGTLEKATEVLRGDYAIAVVTDQAPGVVFAARAGHPPLLVGLGEGECFLASDVLALAPHTRDIVAVESGEIAVLTRAGAEVTRGGERVQRAPIQVPWTPADAERNGHATFMHKEIHEQPSAIRRTLGAWPDGGAAVPEARWRGLRRLVCIACGTSHHASLVGRWYAERLARLPVVVDVSSEFLFREPLLGPDDLVVVVSQSGETADTLAALQLARAQGAQTLAVCNVPGSSMTREADGVLMTATGPEIGVASTKAFTAQLVVLLRLAVEAGRARGVLAAADAEAALRELATMPALMERLLREEDRYAGLAGRLDGVRDFFYIGRGLYYPIALEGALKLKEIAYVRAEAFPGGELKHGPLALVDDQTVTVALAPAGPTHSRMLATIQEVRARGGRVVALGSEGDDALAPLADVTLEAPAASDSVMPALLSIPLQLLAYHIAVRRGCNVDRPRNLAKSVTVE